VRVVRVDLGCARASAAGCARLAAPAMIHLRCVGKRAANVVLIVWYVAMVKGLCAVV
jgi:hypothetical protein